MAQDEEIKTGEKITDETDTGKKKRKDSLFTTKVILNNKVR